MRGEKVFFSKLIVDLKPVLYIHLLKAKSSIIRPLFLKLRCKGVAIIDIINIINLDAKA